MEFGHDSIGLYFALCRGGEMVYFDNGEHSNCYIIVGTHFGVIW